MKDELRKVNGRVIVEKNNGNQILFFIVACEISHATHIHQFLFFILLDGSATFSCGHSLGSRSGFRLRFGFAL